MLKNWLAVGLRNLAQGPYTAINLAGLVVGVTACLLIALYVGHELSFDRYHSRADRLYRVSRDFYPVEGQPDLHLAAMAPAAAPLLVDDFLEIESAARISRCSGAGSRTLIASANGSFFESGFVSADNELFGLFDFDWLHGDPATALLEPSAVVVTESTARRYFGRTDVLGETLLIDTQVPIEVTGVIADLPDNTHLRFSLLGSLRYAEALGDEFLRQWNLNCFHTYVLLAEGADSGAVQAQAGEFFDRHLGDGASRLGGFTLQPVPEIHLRSNREGELSAPGSLATVYAFSAIAAIVLALACFNFVNFATARSAQRAKEVGIRKAVGGTRGQLIAQFLGESALVAALAVLIAAAVTHLLLGAFSSFVETQVVLDYSDPETLMLLGALTLFVAAAAGSYPALYVSSFAPLKVLRGDVTRGSAAAVLRSLLVVLQFAISIALLIATVIVYAQTRYARTIDVGFDAERIVVLTGSPTRGLGPQWSALKREWLAHSGVLGVTASNITPGAPNSNSVRVGLRAGGGEPLNMRLMVVDFGFFETYGIELSAGRAFSEDFGTDRLRPNAGQPATAAFVLNELGARRLGLAPAEAVGRSLEAFGATGPVVGIAADVHFESIRNAIEPVIFVVPPEQAQLTTLREASLRVSGDNLEDTLRHIDVTWSALVPDQPLMRRFLAQDFEALYRDADRQARVLLAFTILAVLIACLGLVGLASFTTEQRAKEIGIRKVMGGTVWDIVRLFTAEFVKLVLVANAIAWPVAYFSMRRWLDNFAYRIEMSVLVFIACAALALALAVLAVGTAAARAGSAKPIRSLRYE